VNEGDAFQLKTLVNFNILANSKETTNMSKKTKSVKHSRRDFLLKGMVAIGGTATLAAVGSAGAVAKPDAKPTAAAATETAKGYQETAHVREYYERARF
jgi:nitrous oxide reductase